MWLHALCIVIILIIDVFGCLIPVYTKASSLKNKTQGGSTLNYLNAFGFGTMIALVFSHLLPEAYLTLKAYESGSHDHSHDHNHDHSHDHSHDHNHDHNHNHWSLFSSLCIVTVFALLFLHILMPHSCGQEHGHSNEITHTVYSTDTIDTPKTDSNKKKCQHPTTEDPSNIQSKWVVCCSLFVHSVIEGIVIGGQTSAKIAVMISLLMCGHKWVEGMVISTSFMKEDTKNWKIACALFVIATPLGIIIGMIATGFQFGLLFDGVMNIIASFSLLYILFTDIGQDEFGDHSKYKKRKLLVALGGVGTMYALTYLSGVVV